MGKHIRIAKFLSRWLALALALSADLGLAKGVQAQLVLTFPSKRPFSYEYLAHENALLLEFGKTTPSELSALEHYDERLVRRVLIKEQGHQGTEVRLVLRDRRVRAVVNQLTEPFRVAIDLFEAGYKEEKDPQTGLPLVTAGSVNSSSASAGSSAPLSSGQLLNQEGGSFVDSFGKPGALSAAESAEASGKRRLLQPVPEKLHSAEELTAAVREAPEGIGKSWASYPRYIYRLQSAAYEAGLSFDRNRDVPSPVQAMSSVKAMADYAGKLYNLGHESRALVAYQQVLHRDPAHFDRDALSLWKLAEAHFGQGNLTLARGYYEALAERHPESPLAAFSRLRVLDIAAIRLINQGRSQDLPQLVPQLDKLAPKPGSELPALVAIRKAYWAPAAANLAADAIAPIDGSVHMALASAYPNLEGLNRTAFMASSLLLADMTRPEVPWQHASGQFADAYFKRFSGPATEPWRQRLHEATQAKIATSMRTKVADGKLIEAIDDYEALPASLKSVDKEAATAWALGEAYRKLNQPGKAADHYRVAARTMDAGPDRFKAHFWLSVTAGEHAESLRASRGGAAAIERARTESRTADRAAEDSWNKLTPEEQRKLAVAYKEPFEKSITSPTRLRLPAKVVLSSWTQSLSTRATADTGNDPSDWERAFSPSGSAVILLSDLAKRFGEMGMTNERRQSLDLLRSIKPSDLQSDKAAKDIWARQLLLLADDYRKASQYLDAGRIYSLVGSDAENFEGRAEALYKGGLLLYRAGRREEAIAAFKKAEGDGNNLFYANLARERLSQLE